MPAIPTEKLPKHLQFDYSQAKTLQEMDEIDGSAEMIRAWQRGEFANAPGPQTYKLVEHRGSDRKRITMSIPSYNLTRLKIIANKKEIPYQTYLNSIIKEHVDREMMSTR